MMAPPPAIEHEDRKEYSGAFMRMTPELLAEICKERHMWSQPQLNTQLYLNYKGFDTMEGLEDYCLVRSLHLGNNNIRRIDGLDRMSELRSLHLEGNRILQIENLSRNLELRQLNLEGNAIKRVDGLSHLLKLEHLNLSRNAITSLEDLEELKQLPALANVDVSHNEIEATEGVIEFWAELKAVKVLRYHANPGVRNVEHYRKRLINAMPSLTYLDERPVFPVERKSAAAWATGGLEAMHKAKRDHHEEQNRQWSTVDPERREMLTRNRKLAIERIEKEEQERREKEGKVGEKHELKPRNPESGDPEALANYEKTWQTKVALHGIDGVRAQVSISNGSGHTVPAVPSQPEHRINPEHSFQPPPRSVPVPSTAEFVMSAVEPTERSRRDGGSEGLKGASHFAQRSAVHHDATDTAVEMALESRQAAVLGDDIWAGTASGKPTFSQDTASANGATRRGQNFQAEPEVMPQIWEKLGPAAKESELRALDMNMSHLSDATTGMSRSQPANVEALDILD